MPHGAPVDCVTPPEPIDAGAHRAAGPFLKWAGGKRQLLPQLRRFVPPTFATYHEPFLGSAALFFDLWSRGRLEAARLSDTNTALVDCYDVVRREPAALVAALRRLEARHRQLGAEHYYEARTRFNLLGARWSTGGGGPDTCPIERAALFVYLNRTGFNGLYRLNARGEFNVPAGRYRNPRICDEAGIHAAAEALRGPGTRLDHAPWQRVLQDARANDFVYFDPPYAPVSATARFTHYTAAGFGDDEQRELAQAVVTLARRGCHVVLSNSTAPLMTTLYEQDADVAAAGVRAWRVPARRAINAHAAGRGDVMELIVSNVPPVVP
jgi:DNA adenine methylase